MLGAAADDDTVAGVGDLQNDFLGDAKDALAVNDFELVGIDAAFEAAAQEGFEEAVIERIVFFFAALDDSLRAIGETGDFFGEAVVPEFPAEALGEQASDIAAAAAVFAFDGNDFDHGSSPGSRIIDSSDRRRAMENRTPARWE